MPCETGVVASLDMESGIYDTCLSDRYCAWCICPSVNDPLVVYSEKLLFMETGELGTPFRLHGKAPLC